MELRIAVVSLDARLNKDIKAKFEKVTAKLVDGTSKIKVFEGIPSIEEAVVHFGPHMILVNFEDETKAEKTVFLEQLNRVAERIPVIATKPVLEAEFMLGCIKKGVRDFLRQPLQDDEVEVLLKRVVHEQPKKSEVGKLATTYAFFSYKGGVGTTFLSANSAVAMAMATGGRVLIWDMVFQNGDVSFFFDHDPPATLSELIENFDKLDAQYLNGLLPAHSSGVYILSPPKHPEEAESIRSDQIQSLHQVLRKYYDYIFVDAGHSLTDSVIGVMDISKYIFLTTDLHLPVLKNTLRCLEVFERLGYIEGKFKILLNRYNSKYEKFDLSKAEEILRYPVSYSISNDYITASRSLNAGVPVLELEPKSVLAKEFNGLADLLLSEFVKQDKKPSLLGGLFRKDSSKAKGTSAPAEPPPAQPQ